MPVEVRGLKEARKALRSFAPDLEKNLNKQVHAFAAPVVNEAKGYVQASPGGLTNWIVGGSAAKFKKSTESKKGSFPKFNASEVKQGIRFSTAPTKRNSKGFISLYRILNSSRAGAIYERAGTVNKNHSKTARPNFNEQLGGYVGKPHMQGRLIFKAWAHDQGKTTGKVAKAVDDTLREFQAQTNTKSVVIK